MNNNVQLVSYLGMEESYSYLAAKKYFTSKVKYHSKSSITDVITDVTDGKSIVGIVPIENTTTGSIFETYDLLTKHNVFIIGEVYLCIHHQLLVNIGTNLRDVRVCYSHLQAINQCQKFLQNHPSIEFVYTSDTATAAYEVSKSESTYIAAIASSDAATRYKLTLAQENIEDNPKNFTRFSIISKKLGNKGNKVSLLLSVKHIPGSLYHAMEPMAALGFNLTKIESRPIMGTLWEYLFILDFEIGNKIEQLSRVLTQLDRLCKHTAVLGVYERGKTYET